LKERVKLAQTAHKETETALKNLMKK
jgi:hypothetical protein